MLNSKIKPTAKATELKRPHFSMDASGDANPSPLMQHPISMELDIENRINWITSLCQNHGLVDGPFGKTISNTRNQIAERQRESRLFVGVIGEFSSGKSTLINALIRKRLLKTDVLQGTTAAVTVIQHGEKFNIEVVRRKKSLIGEVSHGLLAVTNSVKSLFSSKRDEPTEADLLDALHETTTNEEIAKDVMQVNVMVPTNTLQEGLVIVDTPGANARNPRHGELTARAIENLCDAALVVIPAEMAGSLSLVNYLKENAGNLIHRCIFLVNKMDHLRRRKDQEKILEFTANKIREEFGIQHPRVLAAAPQFVIATLESDSNHQMKEEEDLFSAEEIQRWVSEFQSMESEMRKCLVDKRLQAQADDVSLLLGELYKTLGSNLGSMIKEYEEQHQALEQLVIPDIDGFISDKAERYAEKASSQIQRLVRGFDGDLVDHGKAVVNAVRYAIVNAKDKKELRQTVESTVPRIIRNGESKYVSMVRRLSRDVTKLAQREFKHFHSEFQEHFRSLASLDGRIDVDRAMKNRSVANSNTTGQLNSVTSRLSTGLQAIQEADTTKIVGGGAAGAVAGTLILPGIGTIIGGLAGSFLSSLFGPSLDELKAGCLENIVPPLANSLDELIDRAIDDVNDFCSEAIGSLHGLILDYAPTYAGLVETMRQRDQHEKERLAAAKYQVASDQQLIQQQKESLELVRNKIRQI